MTPFDASGAFRPVAEGGGELRRLAVRGAGVTVFSGGLGLAIQIAATVVLARLLTPGDFGLVTMVTTFSLLLVNFGLNGFTEAVLQRDQIDHALVSNLFWVDIGAGLLLTIGFASAGSLLARFYGNPHVAQVAFGISITIFFTSTSVQHLALLKRGMRFPVLAANDILARAVSLAVSIVLAWAGWKYWSLVAGAVALSLVTSMGAWFLCRWTPGLPRRVAGTGSMVRFAMNVYGRFSVDYFARNMDNLLVGWRFGSASLGLYKKAYDLFALSANQLSSPLTNVAVAALSRLRRTPEQYRRYLLSSLAVMAFVGMGLSADLTLVGKDLIRLLLGPKWEPAGRIFTYFGPGIGVMLLDGASGWIHLSLGRADRWLIWGVVEFAVTGLLFILGLAWGPAGVAVAWAASFWILTIPALWYAGRPIHLGVAPVIAAVWKFPAAALLAGCGAATFAGKLPSLAAAAGSIGALTRLAAVSVLFGTLYLGAVILLHRGCSPLHQVAGLLREMVQRRRFSRPPEPPVLAEARLMTLDVCNVRES
ncbi:MAG: lipopolysaccharide biosynthesis protein [Acidobacteriia bacterium]|nr:lipopolysaccharide biosynthesis protein [Terriglobia bacterium]